MSPTGPAAVVETARLVLRPMVVEDAPALFTLFGDERLWWYDPDGRHRVLADTERYASRAAASWERHGLSYWTARLRSTGEVVGSGGVQWHDDRLWNLNYRISAEHQGQGLAGELVEAGLAAARRHRAGAPCVAFIDAVNEPSLRVARWAGLLDRGEQRSPADGRARLALSDRPLDEER